MTECQQLMICTDLDRTLLPNGHEPESPRAQQLLTSLINKFGIKLVYVTGRSKALVEKAIADYQLPWPDYVISNVGTSIYQINNRDFEPEWQLWDKWHTVLDESWCDTDPYALAGQLAHIIQITPQDQSEQSVYKLSYYLDNHAENNNLKETVEKELRNLQICANLIISVDDLTGRVLLDILPEGASKLHAIEFLLASIDHSDRCILFAGDSGNDLAVLTSEIPSVLVANASDSVRQQAVDIATQNGTRHLLHLARGMSVDLNGNYSAGILEGLFYFFPQFNESEIV